jgi:carbonic anhydrase
MHYRGLYDPGESINVQGIQTGRRGERRGATRCKWRPARTDVQLLRRERAGALGELDPAWSACNSGEIQSPVDFKGPPQGSKHRQLSIHYGDTTGEIFNNGHTIEVEAQGTNVLVLDGIVYELKQFHFHTPSEHRINGRGYDMELHLVHAAADGTLAVIGVLLKRGPTSEALAPIFASLPNELNVREELEHSFNPADFLPKSREHYRYRGSLTTPACAEGVNWIVMAQPMTVSDEDMAQLATRIKFNARPVQRSVGQH